MKQYRSRITGLLSVVVILVGLTGFALSAHAGGGTLSLQKTAPFDAGISVTDAVKNECQLETKLVDFTQEFASGEFDKIVLVDNASAATPGKAVKIVITDVAGAKGGLWSGPKFVSIKATMWQDGKVVGTLSASRSTSGGMYGGYKGTCSLLGRCTKTLGKDVAAWMKDPKMDARAGEAR